MVNKIRVVNLNAPIDESSADAPFYLKSDTVEVNLDQFYKDYRKATWALPCDSSRITPTEFFWKWVGDNANLVQTSP